MLMTESQPGASSLAHGEQGRGRVVERFGPSSGRPLGAIAIAVALLVIGDALRHGLSRGSLLTSLLAAFAATACWMILVRPRLTAYERMLVVSNFASDFDVPWHLITHIDMRQTLRIYLDTTTIHAVGVGKTTRQLTRASRPGLTLGGFANSMGPVAPRPGYHDHVMERLGDLRGAQQEASLANPIVVRRWAIPELVVLSVSLAGALVLALTG